MSLIQCPGCRTGFKVQRDVLGKQMKCPKCRKRFVAESKRGAGGGGGGGSGGYIWAGVAVVAFAGLIVFTTSDDGDKNSSAKAEPRTAQTPIAPVDDLPIGWGDDAPDRDEQTPASDATDLRSRIDELLDAVKFADESRLQAMTTFPYFHDRLAKESGGDSWNLLDAIGQNRATQSVLDHILGSAESQDFLKNAYVEDGDFEIVEEQDQTAKVSLTHQVKGVDGKTQAQTRTIELRRSTKVSPWMITWVATSEPFDPKAAGAAVAGDPADGSGAAAAPGPSEEAQAKRRARLGKVVIVPHLDETPAARRSELDALAAKLTDLSLTREAGQARRELVKAGKEAIPPLLNVMVGRENLLGGDDAMIVNQAVQALRPITGEDFGFSPATNAGSMAGAEGGVEQNRQAIARWFGWWERHKDSWTGREDNPPSDDGES